MAKETVLTCDFDHSTCRRLATRFKLWREGDKQSLAIDLCEEHAKPLLDIFEHATLTDLPTKPRARMEVTKLVATPKTQHLKKKD